jgi:hypothetical protein
MPLKIEPLKIEPLKINPQYFFLGGKSEDVYARTEENDMEPIPRRLASRKIAGCSFVTASNPTA